MYVRNRKPISKCLLRVISRPCSHPTFMSAFGGKADMKAPLDGPLGVPECFLPPPKPKDGVKVCASRLYQSGHPPMCGRVQGVLLKWRLESAEPECHLFRNRSITPRTCSSRRLLASASISGGIPNSTSASAPPIAQIVSVSPPIETIFRIAPS